MIKAIMAVDDKNGVSKDGSMPWPKNVGDLKWFKENTTNNVVIMGKKTWIDPIMPAPLKNRVNILITNQNPDLFIGADDYISGDLILKINKISNYYSSKEKWIIGGPNIIDQTIGIIDEFYLTRIYGDHKCDTQLNIKKILVNMKLEKKIENDDSSHFEIWKK